MAFGELRIFRAAFSFFFVGETAVPGDFRMAADFPRPIALSASGMRGGVNQKERAFKYLSPASDHEFRHNCGPDGSKMEVLFYAFDKSCVRSAAGSIGSPVPALFEERETVPNCARPEKSPTIAGCAPK